MKLLTARFMLIGLVSLAACSVDQQADVRAYRTILDLGPAPEVGPSGPLRLQDALRLTNAYNENLSIEGENYVQSLADRQRNAASLLPTLDLFGNLTFRDNSGGDSGGSTGGTKSTLFDAGLGAQYTLFTGLTDFNRVKAADFTTEQGRWLLLDLRESILLDTARAYYSVLLSERLVNVLESSLVVQEERLRDVRGRQDVGFARPLDVAQIESQVSATQVLLLDARNFVRVGRSALTLLVGADASGMPLTDAYELPAEMPSSRDLLAIALSQRQDLAAAVLSAEASRATVDSEIGRYFPTVTVNLDYFLTRDTIPTQRDWTGLLTVNLPLFTAGRIHADVRDAWSRFRQDLLRFSLTKREIRRDVEVAQANLEVAQQRLLELNNQLRAAQEALRQAEASYNAGLGTNLERIAAQDQLLSAQVGLAREDFNVKIAYLVAMRAAGALTQAVVGVVPMPPPQTTPPESPFIITPSAGAPAVPAPDSEHEADAEAR